jgi:2',3'-cyclic-nucleotide 2'-phosphodiesterase
MNILYIGDVMGMPGIDTVKEVLPVLKKQYDIDLTIAQSENVTEGKGMLPEDMKLLQKLGIDFFTGGNHTPKRQELSSLLANPESPVIGPANLPSCPGKGWKYIETRQGRVLIISLLGATVGREVEITNPLHAIDEILEQQNDEERVATIVNFHGDYSSEKVIIGYYLDGKVSAVIGDHWHVPTADAKILPKGTAHITDVGMCGTLHSSLGVTFESVIPRWRDSKATLNVLSIEKPYQFNAVLVNINDETGLASSISPIQKILD